MLQRTLAIMTMASVVMLFVLLITTTPSTVGPLGILGFFVFLYLFVMGLLTFVFYGLTAVVTSIITGQRKKIAVKPLSFKHSYYYASVLALAPIMLIAMQSVGEIGVYQVLLVGLFIAVAWMYVTNRTS